MWTIARAESRLPDVNYEIKMYHIEMKKITFFPAAAATLLLAMGMSGCSKENGVPKGESCRLSLTGNTLDLAVQGQSVTRAGTEALPDGLELGVHVVDLTSGEDVTNMAIANVKHVTDASGAINNTNPDPIILTTGYTYDVYAYSPFVAGTTTTVPVAHGTDVLWAKAAGEKPNAATHSTNLTFGHKTAQVSFSVVADATSDPDLTGATLKVTGFCKDGSLDLATGNVTVGTVDNTIELTDIGQAVCFLPTAEAMPLNVAVTVPAGQKGEGSYSGTITKVFEPGKSYIITVTVIDRNAQLGLVGGVVPWVDQTGDLDVNN